MARIFGYDSLDEFLSNVRSLGSRIMVNPDSMQAFYNQVRERGEIKRFEAEYYRRDGKTIWASLNARAIYGESGELIFIEGILEDITDRKKAEQDLADLNRHLEQLDRDRTEDLVNKARELEEANQRLRELDEMKSAFLSSVSHELRTPLPSILGFSKLLHKEFGKNFLPLAGEQEVLLKKGQRIQENLSIISHEGERLTRLINDVLDLNKIESGRMGWRDERLNMSDTVELAVQAVKGMFAQNSAIKLLTEVDSGLPSIMADPDRMQQVLINLLNNAAKFTEKGSVTVRAFPRFGQVRIEVADTGLGIHPDDQSQIFEKFHQTRTDTMEDKPKGTGLGLTICREIIEHYGGRIWVESELHMGSTFIFTLPTAP
jgi:PAS domain S-box-containing protein